MWAESIVVKIDESSNDTNDNETRPINKKGTKSSPTSTSND